MPLKSYCKLLDTLGHVPRCRRWRVCQHCYGIWCRERTRPIESMIAAHPGEIVALTIDLPGRAWRTSTPMLSNLQRWIRGQWPLTAYARKTEVADDGMIHVHYLFVCISHDDIPQIQNYLEPRLSAHLQRAGVSVASPMKVTPANAHWCDYILAPYLPPGLHVPRHWQARYPLQVFCRKR